MTSDEQERSETRETIHKTFDLIGELKDSFHQLDNKVVEFATDLKHMTKNGCESLDEDIKDVRAEIMAVNEKHDNNFIKTSAFVKTVKYLIVIATALIGGLITYFKKG